MAWGFTSIKDWIIWICTWIPGWIICRHIWAPDWIICKLIWTLHLIISKCMWIGNLREYNREWTTCRTKSNDFHNNMAWYLLWMCQFNIRCIIILMLITILSNYIIFIYFLKFRTLFISFKIICFPIYFEIQFKKKLHIWTIAFNSNFYIKVTWRTILEIIFF